MTILFKQLLITTVLVFTVYLLNVLLIQDIHAETVVEEMRKKGQQCRSWIDAGDIMHDRAKCVASCWRYAETVTKHPEYLTDESVRRCNKAYAITKNRLPGMKKPTIPITKDPNDRTSKVPHKLPKTTMSSMPDLEGVYLQATRSGIRVRVEGREDWKTYCNEAARIKNGQDEFSRKVKPKDRIRLVGITYDASKANKVVSRCLAESVVILGSSKE